MKLYGLFGKPIGHSISPQLHQLIYEKAGIDALYLPFEIEADDLGAAVKGVQALKMQGMNVTIPYKADVIPFLDRLDSLAERLGAVNTIQIKPDELVGYNTDYYGVETTFRHMDWPIQGKSAYIMGTGGAAQAIAHCLKDHGANPLILVSLTPEEDKLAIPEFDYISYDELPNRSGDYLINATPVGMYPKVDESLVGPDIISNFNCLFDSIYNPSLTKFLSIGQDLGKETTNGLMMLLAQGIKSVEIWEGHGFPDHFYQEIYTEIAESWEKYG